MRNDAFVQIGYDDYRTLSFGSEAKQPNNGKFAIEYWSGLQGLNFWKPWPTANPSNFNLFLRDDGNAGIGTAGDAKFKLDVNGFIRCWALTVTSDKRLKSNIKPLESSLEKVLKLNGVSYVYNFQQDKYNGVSATKDLTESKQNTMAQDAKLTAPSDPRLGLIAQEVETVIPEVIRKDEKGYLSINYIDLIPLLIESIKEQNKKIEGLEQKLRKAEARQEATKTFDAKTQSNLQSNFPNPFGNNTVVRYFISEMDATNAVSLNIYDQKGVLMAHYNLDKKAGEGEMSIKTENLQDGMFFYSLVVNGKVIDSKVMLKVSSN